MPARAPLPWPGLRRPPSPTTQSFTYTGAEQTFTVPVGVFSLHVLAVGGRGGANDLAGGVAAQVSGKLKVTPGQTLYIEVGGGGQNGGPSGGGGGFNGGGSAGSSEGGGGGGASDVRTSPSSAGLAPEDRLRGQPRSGDARPQERGSRRKGVSPGAGHGQLTLLGRRRRIFERCEDVVALEVGVVGEDLVNAAAGRELPQHGADGDAGIADTGQPAHAVRVDGDSIESHDVKGRPEGGSARRVVGSVNTGDLTIAKSIARAANVARNRLEQCRFVLLESPLESCWLRQIQQSRYLTILRPVRLVK